MILIVMRIMLALIITTIVDGNDDNTIININYNDDNNAIDKNNMIIKTTLIIL